MSTRPAIFEHMTALSDTIRCRLLLLLEEHELAVSELCAVVQLPQSTVSRHLKLLMDGGWVTARREATSRLYGLVPDGPAPEAEVLWRLVREAVSASASALQDRDRLREVVAQRRFRSQEFFSSAAQRWAQLRRELFGDLFDLQGLLGLLPEDWTIADLGCGTGEVASCLAPFVRRVVAIDDSQAMLESARQRLSGQDNVEILASPLESLPLADRSLDAVTLVLVLHHLAQPQRVLAEAGRVLKVGGRLLVVDMQRHEREEYRQNMGHVWLGFGHEQLDRWFETTGFESARLYPLPPAADARGPGLFVARSRKKEQQAGLTAAASRA